MTMREVFWGVAIGVVAMLVYDWLRRRLDRMATVRGAPVEIDGFITPAFNIPVPSPAFFPGTADAAEPPPMFTTGKDRCSCS